MLVRHVLCMLFMECVYGVCSWSVHGVCCSWSLFMECVHGVCSWSVRGVFIECLWSVHGEFVSAGVQNSS